MNSLFNNLKILFFELPPEKIGNLYELRSNRNSKEFLFTHNYISKDKYSTYSFGCCPQNSLNEREIYFDNLKEFLDNTETKSFFELFAQFGKENISLNGDIPLVKFERIIQWREISHLMGQAVIVSALLAKNSVEKATEYEYWNWPTALKTDNRQLIHLLADGISENHFHLNGSTQIFPISWISIMNNPSIIKNRLEKISENLYPRLSYSANDNSTSWETLLKNSAIFRINLFSKIHSEELYGKQSCSEYEKLSESQALAKTFSEIESSAYRIAFSIAYKTQQNKVLDYALTNDLSIKNYGYNRILIGERKFLYDCFKSVFNDTFSELEKNQFYYYILVKNKFRCELIQTNNQTGFKNFSKYQDRKGFFFSNIEKYEREAVRLSLNDTLQCQSIKSLEARIMPQKTPFEMKAAISYFDEYYKEAKEESQAFYHTEEEVSEILKNKLNYTNIEHDYDSYQKDNLKFPYFYVLHYPKNKTDFDRNEKSFVKPRNYNQRKNNKIYSKTIAYVLSKDNNLRRRIRGIDTCSFEILCRPEVFAVDYRFLREYSSQDDNISSLKSKKVFLYLGRTYHAGEDFYDIVDGLRTIDEVIRFLEFSNGDRLGHAIALGINPTDHYYYKGNKVILPKQEALDNFIWLYYISNSLNIEIEPLLKQNLLCKIDKLKEEIYGDFCERNKVNCSHYNLFCAWKLRGDAPELYFNGKFEYPKFELTQYDKCKYSKDYELDALRNNYSISMLYHAYHYDLHARIEGEKSYEFSIDKKYANLVLKIQNGLQKVIARKGIMIECNPSSNYLISTFKDYAKHPIKAFYNLGLETDSELLADCPQISVSINTDDQGVFDTSLEYEYALMASALITATDDAGNYKYSPAMVYDYLDNIRKLGNQQSFTKI